MLIDRTNFNLLVDDDGTNLVGTVWDKAQIKNVILDPVEAGTGGAYVHFDAVGVSGIPSTNFGNRATLNSYFNNADVKVLQDQTSAKVYIISGASVGSNGAFLALLHARGSLIAPMPIQNGDVLGSIVYEGYYGTITTPGDAFNHAVEITAYASETWDSTHQGARLELRTMAVGNNTVPGQRLIIADAYNESKSRLIVPVGTETDPAIQFGVAGGTGVWAPLPTAVAFSCSGNRIGMFVAGATNGLYLDVAEATGNPANMYRDPAASGGYVKVSTSLRRTKRACTPIPVTEARRTIGALEAITYQSALPHDDPDHTWPGFIAEDVEAVTPSLVMYGGDGGLQSVAYDRVPCYLVPLAQDHERRLEQLEHTIAHLTGAAS